jgi:hypothetical protein
MWAWLALVLVLWLLLDVGCILDLPIESFTAAILEYFLDRHSHGTRSLVRIAENWLLALPLVHHALRTRRRYLLGMFMAVWSVVGLLRLEVFSKAVLVAWFTFFSDEYLYLLLVRAMFNV